jgi:hypothetical protein
VVYAPLSVTHIFMFAAEGNDWNPAESEPLPRLYAVRGPVSAVMTLCCDAFVAFQLAGEVCDMSTRLAHRELCEQNIPFVPTMKKKAMSRAALGGVNSNI